MKENRAKSDILELYSLASNELKSFGSFSFNFQTNKKASPMFLFADPPYLSTYECVISAISFTKSITLV